MAKLSRRKTNSIDHGYAWVILASTASLQMLIGGFWSSFGVILVNVELYFGVSPGETAIIGAICMMLLFGSAPVTSAVANRLSYQVVVVLAGILIVICFLATNFVTQPWHIYIIMALSSVGMGMSTQAGFTYFIYYFKKHLTVAHMLNNASSGIGYLSIPPAMEFLISQYGLKGAFQILAAIMGHICACGLLLREPKHKTQQQERNQDSTLSANRQHNSWQHTFLVFLKDVAKDFDLSLFRNVRFLFQGVVNGFLQGSLNAAIIYLVPYSRSMGESPTKASYLMTTFGVGVVVARLSPIGVMVDKNIISASTLGGVLRIILGLVIFATPFTRTYKQLMTIAGLFGILQGASGPLLYAIVAQSPGSREKGPAASAWFLLNCGLGSTATIYLVGFLNDSTGSYTFSLILLSICIFMSGVILLFDPCLTHWHDRSMEKHEDSTSNNR